MSILAYGIVAVVSFVAGLYSEYRAGQADAKALEQRVAADVRAEVRSKLDVVVTDIKSWEAQAAKVPGEVIGQVEARIKQIL